MLQGSVVAGVLQLFYGENRHFIVQQEHLCILITIPPKCISHRSSVDYSQHLITFDFLWNNKVL